LLCITIFVLAIGVVATLFLIKYRNSLSPFPPSNSISCISVNSDENPYNDDAPKAYTKSEKVLDGKIYDGSNAKDYVYSLIKSGAINTFEHTSADICLTSYEENNQKIVLGYKAQQIYYTNEKNIEKYAFTVEINKTNNTVTIKGE